ncbi:DUF1285 domain-containing protein [Blastomonas sp. UPD001]|jgi:uncharacterized protein|uniref:DUF1285 domain-containing protein n=1 Tax=Blastomonas sp. UPD001 TaxID=2217673 RepID=UPI000E3543DF|nr:DUF1285 domain-containing protein [Blastomonas sp. UPD001]MBL0967088.1 DUF1285 domain-containing protein [Blastomonas sp.]
MPYDPPPELQDLSLADIAGLVAARKLPPVEQWNPAHQSDSHMRIAADGRWYHQGGLISRPAMVRLFASVLRREPDGRYALVTPFEQQWIEVEDAPLLAVELKSEGTGGQRRLAFRLNTDELVVAGHERPIILRGDAEEPRPYLGLWRGLEARIERAVYYDLVELALEEAGEADTGLPIWSDGACFRLDRIEGA